MLQLDANKAIKGSGLSSNFLQAGKHTVKITQAYHKQSQGGATAIHFDVQDANEAKGSFEIWTHKADGSVIDFNEAKVHAIMACAGIQAISQQSGSVLIYDRDSKQDVPTPVSIYPELTGKFIGVVLQKELSTNNDKTPYIGDDGKPRTKIGFLAPFNYQTEQTAAEVINQKPAESLPHIVAAAEKNSQSAQEQYDRLSGMPNTQGQTPQQPQPQQQPAYAPNDFDDDVPF